MLCSQKELISGVKITALDNSPNIDSTCIFDSQVIKVHDCNIAYGDDCISKLSGIQNVDIFDVAYDFRGLTMALVLGALALKMEEVVMLQDCI